MTMIPTQCRIVIYTLTQEDAELINYKRSIKQARDDIQDIIGNPVAAGETYPMLIVRCFGNSPDSAVNGRLFLDGDDTFWVRSTSVGEGPGKFQWPQIPKLPQSDRSLGAAPHHAS